MLLAGIKNGSDAEITYTYDARGNIKTVSEGGVLKQTYHYDELGRLIRMDDTVTNCTYGYRYNPGGNLTGMDVYDQYIDPDDPDYTSYNLLTTRDYRYQDSGNWKDLLTYYFGSTITYDAIGNPLNYRNGMTMTWVNGRRLASVTNSGVTTAYTYNDDGIRLTKQVGNNPLVTYETDGGLILCQKTGTGSSAVCVYFFYDASGKAYAMEYNGDMYYYLRNGQGDVIGIIDDTGAVVARYTYDPWGKPLSVTDGAGNTIAANATHVANVNPFRYRGYFYDTETGFYYLQSRYYDPVTGRFINADDVSCLGLEGMVTSYNLFTYCANDPINRFDDSGYGWFSNLIKAVVVVAVVVAVAAVTVATAGAGTVAACIAVGAAKGAAIGMVSGAAIGAGAGAINHRIQTGSWEGAGQAALEGMGEGALSGAITGAITGGIKGYINSSGSVVKPNAKPSGKAFNPNGPSAQIGVDPNTLEISRPILPAKMNAIRMEYQMNGGIYRAVEVWRNGLIYDGNHRVAFAREIGAAIDVIIK